MHGGSQERKVTSDGSLAVRTRRCRVARGVGTVGGEVGSPEPAKRYVAEARNKVGVCYQTLVLTLAIAEAMEVQLKSVGDGGQAVRRQPD